MSKRVLVAVAGFALIAGTSAASSTQRIVSADEAVWSPNGKQIAFINRRNYIYVMNLDGSGLRRITTAGAKQDLAWSPNGKWIAYETGQHIEEVSPSGARHRLLTGRGTGQPDFSPSGRRIACTDFLTHGHVILVMNADGLEQTPVTSSEGNGEVLNYPSWAPDGRRIAFAVGDEGDGPQATPHLAIVNQSGGSRTNLAIGQFVLSIDWSPDGRKLLLVDDFKITVLNLRTQVIQSLGQDSFMKAHWSPNGRKILFANLRGMFVMNSDGSHVRRLLPAR